MWPTAEGDQVQPRGAADLLSGGHGWLGAGGRIGRGGGAVERMGSRVRGGCLMLGVFDGGGVALGCDCVAIASALAISNSATGTEIYCVIPRATTAFGLPPCPVCCLGL
mgnify:CR=1 FL=1